MYFHAHAHFSAKHSDDAAIVTPFGLYLLYSGLVVFQD